MVLFQAFLHFVEVLVLAEAAQIESAVKCFIFGIILRVKDAVARVRSLWDSLPHFNLLFNRDVDEVVGFAEAPLVVSFVKELIDTLGLLEDNVLDHLDLFVGIVEDPVVGVVVPIPEIYNIMPLCYFPIVTQYAIQIIFVFLGILAVHLFVEFRMGEFTILFHQKSVIFLNSMDHVIIQEYFFLDF